jgi:hypothetical protein
MTRLVVLLGLGLVLVSSAAGAVRSAALSDVLRKGLAGAAKTVRCSVTLSDGRLAGPTAVARTS